MNEVDKCALDICRGHDFPDEDKALIQLGCGHQFCGFCLNSWIRFSGLVPEGKDSHSVQAIVNMYQNNPHKICPQCYLKE